MKVIKVPETLFDELYKVKVANRLKAMWQAINTKRRCHTKFSDEDLKELDDRLERLRTRILEDIKKINKEIE